MSTFSDLLGGPTDFLNQVGQTVTNVLDTVSQAKFNWAEKQLTLASKQASIDSAYADIATKQYTTAADQQLLKIQANNALKAAQNGANLSSVQQYSSDSINTTLANVATQIANMGKPTTTGGSNLMLWLTILGVGFAGMQYFKGRK